jgi:hypothetical protein
MSMTDLQKEFEAMGYASWINSDLYYGGRIYTVEYTEWLEKQVVELRKEKSELPTNPNAAIGGGYECSKCGKRHRTSSVHCDVSMDKLTSVNAHGQNTTKP